MGETVRIQGPAYAVIDQALLHHDASNLIAAIFRDLPHLPAEARLERKADEPDVFTCRFFLGAAGISRTFTLFVNDGWEPGRPHVVGADHVLGKRIF